MPEPVQASADYRAPLSRPCPFCKKDVPIDTAICEYCQSNLIVGWQQDYYRKGETKAETLAIVKVHLARGPGGHACAGSIISPSPDGSGLGIWVLSQEDDQACVYDYAGGIV